MDICDSEGGVGNTLSPTKLEPAGDKILPNNSDKSKRIVAEFEESDLKSKTEIVEQLSLKTDSSDEMRINTEEELHNTEIDTKYDTLQKLNRQIKCNKQPRRKCDQCEFVGAHGSLWKHKKAKHEGVRYPCDNCKYAATTTGDLKRHKRSQHERVKYRCDQCDIYL